MLCEIAPRRTCRAIAKGTEADLIGIGAAGADIDPASDRTLTFRGRASVKVAARAMVVSDPVDLDVPALLDLAVSLFLAEATSVNTAHRLALQTNYVSAETGDSTAKANFPVATTISSWPFVTGVDVTSPLGGATIVAFGSSLTDGDGSTKDSNRRWPDVLAERLQKTDEAELGVLNEGIIGNRLLSDSQSLRQAGGPSPLAAVFEQLGPVLGESGMRRFERDVLGQAGVKYVILALGVNDILARAHKKGILAIGTTIPPFEKAIFRSPYFDHFYTPEKDKVRQEVNAWIRSGGEFDGIIDFDEVVRDPSHPTQILPAYDSGDHLHVNDAGNVAQGNVIPLGLLHIH